MRTTLALLVVAAVLVYQATGTESAPVVPAMAADPSADELDRRFRETVLPFVQTYCVGCHGKEKPKGDLDLTSYTTMASVAKNHAQWATIREQLKDGVMPPESAKQYPKPEQRKEVVTWIDDLLAFEARRNASDPGAVPPRRLSNAEYDNTIRDLTGIDIRPTREFPVDPANEAGFDNTGESLTMSPALLKKYLEAARLVADHVILTPDGLQFAPHAAVTDTDRDKFCVNRIINFYKRQRTDYADYFQAAWRFKHRAALDKP